MFVSLQPIILSSLRLLAQIIKLRAQFPDYPLKVSDLIMLVSLPPKLSLIIACQSG